MRKQLLLSLALTAGMLSPAVAAQSFETLDENGNGLLSQQEYNDWVSKAGNFAELDMNNDEFLDKAEFREARANNNWDYDTFDADDDGYVDADEFYGGIYDEYDADEDGHWQFGEWDDAGEEGIFDV